MDGIGTAFDSKVAQEAQKLYRQRKKAAIEALARLEGKHPKNCIL
jgi:hypothetical protein